MECIRLPKHSILGTNINDRNMKMNSYKPPSLMTAHKVEKITALRRADEQRISELSKYSHESRWLSNCAQRESMVDQAREANLMARKVAEEQQRKLLLEKQETRRRELASKELERRLVTELYNQKTEQEKREREIQRICETSEELKGLERQLKIAYVNKERAAQHQESMLLRKLENDREQAIEEKMEYDRQLDIRRQEERENNRRRSLIAQKEALQKQMLGKEVSTILLMFNVIVQHCNIFNLLSMFYINFMQRSNTKK